MLYSHIIVAFDGSAQSRKALDQGIRLVESELAGELTVVHVYSFPYLAVADAMVTASAPVQKELYDKAEALLEEAAQKIKHIPHARTELLEGSPAQSILSYTEQNDGSLIIIGTRGLGGLREFMLGSVSHNIAQHSSVPVLIVK